MLETVPKGKKAIPTLPAIAKVKFRRTRFRFVLTNERSGCDFRILAFVDAETALFTELWHACAGPLVTVPREGERVFYFPQGHIEQVSFSH